MRGIIGVEVLVDCIDLLTRGSTVGSVGLSEVLVSIGVGL